MTIGSRICVRAGLVAGVVLLAAVVLYCADDKGVAKPEAKPALAVSIAVPSQGNRNIIVNGLDSHFHVVVTNVSDKPVRLWREWCSWGYFNLTFRLVDANGEEFVVKKLMHEWTKNYPDFMELGAGEHCVIDVYPFRGWENFASFFAPKGGKVKLQAVYEIKPDAESKKFNVWTGRIQSDEREYVLYNYGVQVPKKDK